MPTNLKIDDIEIEYPGRCKKCAMRTEVCICNLVQTVDNKIPLTVIMHYKEAYKTTNTSRLAHLILQKSRIFLRGYPNRILNLEKEFFADEKLLFLCLNQKSLPLEQLQIDPHKKYHLVVPDGTWSQVARIGKREPLLHQAQWIQLPLEKPSFYQLRKEHLSEGLSTLEAIARVYGALENKSIQAQLENILKIMVKRTLSTRPLNRVPKSSID